MKVLILGILISLNLFAAEEFNMATLGDSISRGFNADKFLTNKNLNWSSGTGPTKKQALWVENFSSHYMKIKKMFPEKKVNAFNYAISGSRSRSLKWQIRRLLKKDKKIHYTTILTGANDLCRMRSNYEKKLLSFKNNMSSSIQKLVEHNKDIKIYLAPIPHFFSLYDSLKDNAKCKKIWDRIPLCKAFLSSKRTKKERYAFIDRVEIANQYLSEVAQKYKENVLFQMTLADVEFDETSVSKVDCFHPSAQGQALISEYTWDPEFILGRELTPDEDFQ